MTLPPCQYKTQPNPACSLSKLSSCALVCVLNTISSAGCSSPFDTNCICTAKFTNLASACLATSCSVIDAVPALNLQKEMCPNLGLPDLSKLSPCAQTCVIKTLTKAKCQGPLDNKCICGLPFEFEVGLCLLGCGLGDLAPALQLQFGVCDPKPTKGQCTATGLWKILQPNCWFKVGTVKTHAARSVSNSWTRRGPASVRRRVAAGQHP